MGNQKSKREEDEVERYLTNTYKNTDLEFSYKEILSFKLRIHDAENYFRTKFDFFLYFNNYLFKERISVLYDNFNSQIEKFSANKPKESFTVLIDFDDESENIERGTKMDFDPLFTIVFEKLEISVILFFDMTNIDKNYILDFFTQLVESVDLYKYNRKFDCLYFLLPNTDYIIKNECAVMYVTDETIHNKKLFFNEETNDLKNEFMTTIFYNCDKNKIKNSINPKVDGNTFIEYFLEEIRPTFIKTFMSFNFLTEIEKVILNNEDQFKILENLIQVCPMNVFVIEEVNINNHRVFKIFLKKILNLLESSPIQENVLVVKLYINTKNHKANSVLNISKIRKFIKKIIGGFNIYEEKSNRRKFILEVFEYTQIKNITSRVLTESENDNFDRNSSSEIQLEFNKLFFYWFLSNKKMKFDLTTCFGILLKNKSLEKLKDKTIIKNIKEFLFSNIQNKYAKESKIVTHGELFNF